ncbi:MAG: DNA-directed RNA polymerase [archaeon]|nr:DNA-directed RNA polymerase [archaeon]
MYMITQAERVVPIPPSKLNENIDDVIDVLTWKLYEGQFGSDKSLTVLIKNVQPVGPGCIVHGDGSVYQTVKFDQLVFRFKENEIIEGNVVQITKYGAFIKFGPLDGLLHISQVMNERVDVDEDNQRLIGKDSKRTLSVGDRVRARIISMDINEKNPQDSKIGLVTRGQVGLGKLEWIAEDEKKRSEV